MLKLNDDLNVPFLTSFGLALKLILLDSLIGSGSMILIGPFSSVVSIVSKSWIRASNLVIWSLWCFIVICKSVNARLLDSLDCISNMAMRSFWILTVFCSSSIFFNANFHSGLSFKISEVSANDWVKQFKIKNTYETIRDEDAIFNYVWI